MKKLLALMTLRRGIRLLFAAFGILVISVIFIGLDSTTGYIVGYLATAMLFFAITLTWRTFKKFIILEVVSFFGIIFLSFLYVEVISRLAVFVGGIGALQSTPMHIIDMVITNVIMFAGAAGLLFGVVGVISVGIVRIVRFTSSRGTNTAASNT